MTVAVQQPQRRESDLSQIAQAVNIATSIFGVGQKMRQQGIDEKNALAAAEQARAKSINEFRDKYTFTDEGSEVSELFGVDPSRAPQGIQIPEGKLPIPRQDLRSYRQTESQRTRFETKEQTAAKRRGEDKLDEAVSDFNTASKKEVEKLKLSEGVIQLLDEDDPGSLDNPIVMNGARQLLGRNFGNVGNPTEKEYARFVGSPSIADKFFRFVNGQFSGAEYTDQDVRDIKFVLTKMNNTAKQQIRREAEKIAAQKAKSFSDINEDDVLDAISVDRILEDIKTESSNLSRGSRGFEGLLNSSPSVLPKANASSQPVLDNLNDDDFLDEFNKSP